MAAFVSGDPVEALVIAVLLCSPGHSDSTDVPDTVAGRAVVGSGLLLEREGCEPVVGFRAAVAAVESSSSWHVDGRLACCFLLHGCAPSCRVGCG